jgi:hypothetical protein
MRTTSDIDSTPQGELVNARIPYVKGIIYEIDRPDFKYATPVHTFNGWCADCYMLRKTGRGFRLDPESPYPMPVKRDVLLEPVAAILQP